MAEVVVTYECPLAGESHAVPGPEVRVLRVGDGGFVIACDCASEPLANVDESPHPTTDHLVNVYADDPSPAQWLVLEDAADGWYDTTAWASPDGYDGTHGQRRARFRERVRELADDRGGGDAGGGSPDPRDERVREVACPACDAAVGEKCQRPSGHRVREAHSDRVTAAVEAGHLPVAGDADPDEDGRPANRPRSTRGRNPDALAALGIRGWSRRQKADY